MRPGFVSVKNSGWNLITQYCQDINLYYWTTV